MSKRIASASITSLVLVAVALIAVADDGGGGPPPPPTKCPNCDDDWKGYPVDGQAGSECRHGMGVSPGCYRCYNRANSEINGVTYYTFEETVDEGNCCEDNAGNDCWIQIKDPGDEEVFEEDEFGEFYEKVTVKGCGEEGACHCYECVPSEGCEGRIEIRRSMCDEIEDPQAGFQCGGFIKLCGKGETAFDQNGNEGCPVRRWKEMETLNNADCSGENDLDGDSAEFTYYCGGFETLHTNCIGMNCKFKAGAGWIITQVAGSLDVCENPN